MLEPPVHRVLGTLVVALAIGVASSSGAALPGTVIAKATARGPFALAVAHGQVDRPTGLWTRLVGKVEEASVLVECLVGTDATAVTYTKRRPGLYRFPVKPAPSDICHITVTLNGRGKILAEVRAR